MLPSYPSIRLARGIGTVDDRHRADHFALSFLCLIAARKPAPPDADTFKEVRTGAVFCGNKVDRFDDLVILVIVYRTHLVSRMHGVGNVVENHFLAHISVIAEDLDRLSRVCDRCFEGLIEPAFMAHIRHDGRLDLLTIELKRDHFVRRS